MTEGPIGLVTRITAACAEAGVDYAIVGAMARNAWAPPRATADLDVAVAVGAEQYERLMAALTARGFVLRRVSAADPDGEVPDLVLLEAPPGPVRRVDILVAKTSFELEAIQESVEVDLGAPCRVVRPAHLVVYKLIAGRPRDLDDCVEVIRTRALTSTPVDLGLVRRWAAEWRVEKRLEDVLSRTGG